MRPPRRSPALTPLRLVRGGALLACAIWLVLAGPALAQVRTHGEAGGSYSVSVTSWRDIPFRRVVRQQYDYSCGSAAIATLMRYHYGVRMDEAEVFEAMYARGDQARIRQVGFSMLDMRSFLESRGFAADGLRVTLDRLAELDIPAIALITRDGYRHFVVIKGVTGRSVLVGDPTFGLQIYARAEFEAAWNGVVLAIRRAPQGTAAPSFNESAEWRPWAVAPLGEAQGPVSPSELTRHFSELYQLSEIRVAD